MSEARAVTKALEGFVERVARNIGSQVTRDVIRDTPVDTGWARANWIPNKSLPLTGTAGTREQAERGIIDTITQANAITNAVGTYNLRDRKLFITNNVPYINTLNLGSSRQAPSGFVQTAIARAIQRVIISLR